MNFKDINIRDPFVLKSEGKYYLYGTRGETAWTSAFGLDVYVSDDLENWSEPKSVFEITDKFWGTCDAWAPEVHYYNNKFYMFASFKAENAFSVAANFHSNSVAIPFPLSFFAYYTTHLPFLQQSFPENPLRQKISS